MSSSILSSSKTQSSYSGTTAAGSALGSATGWIISKKGLKGALVIGSNVGLGGIVGTLVGGRGGLVKSLTEGRSIPSNFLTGASVIKGTMEGKSNAASSLGS